jgi:HD-GYP domain-containing protein (c-di-GMP phosphodiesterase class II)
MKTYPLRTFIHRILLIRIGIATVLISIVIGSITYFTQETRLTRQVADYATKGAEVIVSEVQGVMQSRSLDTADALQAVDKQHRSSTVYDAGRFVYVQFYDASLKVVAEWRFEGQQEIDRYRAFLMSEPMQRPEAGMLPKRMSKIDDTLVVRIIMPIADKQGVVLAYGRGIFAVSPRLAAEIPRTIFRNILVVVAIVFAVAVILYPVILHLMRRLADYSTNLLDANLETLAVLGSAIAKRDSDTDAHNYRVSLYSARIGEAIGLPAEDMCTLVKGAFLHDVGKIGVPDNVLLKPGKLDDQEFSIMKTHVEKGIDIVERSSWLRDAVSVAGYHHEKYGGGGYPHGLRGGDIPITARIFAIADVFDALTSERPYKDPLSFEAAMDILDEGRVLHFDPDVLDTFHKIARELFDRYAGRGGDDLRQELVSLVERCFSSGLEALRYDSN